MNKIDIFSDYDIPKAAVKFGEDEVIQFDTVGKLDLSCEVRVVKKDKRNLPWKQKVRPVKGTLKVSMHAPEEIITKGYGMKQTGYADGIRTYGLDSVHGTFKQSFVIEDEDGNEKLVHFPHCTIETGFAKSVEANQDDIAMIELEISILPDDNKQLFYDKFGTDDEAAWLGMTTEDWKKVTA